MDKKTREYHRPGLGLAIMVALIIVGSVVGLVLVGINVEIALFIAGLIGIGCCLLLGRSWEEIEQQIVRSVGSVIVPVMILICVGINVAAWIAAGTVPSLMYYSLTFITPHLVVPSAFVLCALMSVFTGTSLGSIATMGLAMVGVAQIVGAPIPLTVGSIVSGAMVGDKMSPMSDCTNLVPAMTGTTVHRYISAVMKTSLPAGLITLTLFAILGLASTGDGSTPAQIEEMMAVLKEHYNISIIALFPAILMVIVSVLKVPAILGMGGCALISMGYALLVTGMPFTALADMAANGFVSDTGMPLIDMILTRGGISSMLEAIAIIILAAFFGAALECSGAFDVIMEDGLSRYIKTRRALIFSSMAASGVTNLATGQQYMCAILVGPMFGKSYDRMGIHRDMLARALGDCGLSLFAAVPWSIGAVYTSSVLGCDMSFIPYELFAWVVLAVSVIFTAFGITVKKADEGNFTAKEMAEVIEASHKQQ